MEFLFFAFLSINLSFSCFKFLLPSCSTFVYFHYLDFLLFIFIDFFYLLIIYLLTWLDPNTDTCIVLTRDSSSVPFRTLDKLHDFLHVRCWSILKHSPPPSDAYLLISCSDESANSAHQHWHVAFWVPDSRYWEDPLGWDHRPLCSTPSMAWYQLSGYCPSWLPRSPPQRYTGHGMETS